MTLCDCFWLGCCTSTLDSVLEASAEAAKQSWVRAGLVRSARLRRMLSKSWVVAEATSAPEHGLGSWDSPVGGCKTKQVQKAPSVGAGETGGFVVAAWRSRFTCAHLMGKNRTCAGLCFLGNGTVSLHSPSEWPPDLVFLSACLPLFSKGIFLKIHLFLSLITLVSGSSNSQLFLLLSDWIVKRAGVLQKRYLPFIICKLPSGHKVGVYGFKFIRAIEQSFVMCITWGEEKHLKV